MAEAKNGAVVRKHMGYGRIAPVQAQATETLHEQNFNPFLDFRRPCGVPESWTSAKGKQPRVYRWYTTPWEILRRQPDPTRAQPLDVAVRFPHSHCH